ncbi:hypothetical protein [Lentzea sp. NPDC051838]|uniref:hypothetical protein n=1 Tax=Lentzea sp. NPDC051838 TaxID=3154849 RepID=UPI0034165F78
MRFPAAVTAALVLAALPAPAQAAGCVWTASGLPTHPGVRDERVTGMSPDGSITIGDAFNVDFDVLNGILWFGTTPSLMAEVLAGPGVENSPSDVNNAGIVAGYTYDENTGLTASYRYNAHDGTYEWLQAPNNNGAATDINERGDVVGWINEGVVVKTVLWPAGSTQYQVIGNGTPAGLDEEGHVVTSKGEIWSPDGTVVKITDTQGAYPRAYAGGHAVGVGTGGNIVEWDLSGTVTRTIPGAVTVEAVNASGVIAGLHELGDTRRWAIWSDGGVQDLEDSYVEGITDAGVAYGRQGWDAAIFRCS